MGGGVGIKSIAHVFGKRKVCNADFSESHGFDSSFINNKLGIKYRYAAAEDQMTSDLAADAARLLLTRNNLANSDINCLCTVTQTPDYKLPHVSALVHHKLELADDVATFDINLGCSGYVYGLSVLSSFMQANRLSTGILITADTYSKIINPEDRVTSPLFSDAASATLLTTRWSEYSIGLGTFNTDGTGYDRLIANRHADGNPDGGGCLFMDGRAIYNFMMTKVPDDVNKCLARNGINLNGIDKFVFHQANKFMIDSLRMRMKLDKSRVVYCMEQCGNTVSSSIPIALESHLTENHKNILVSGFGVGLSWASNILTYSGGE